MFTKILNDDGPNIVTDKGMFCLTTAQYADGSKAPPTSPEEWIAARQAFVALPEIIEGLKAVFCAILLEKEENCDHYFQILPPYQAPAVHESACERLWAMIETLTGEAFCPYAQMKVQHDNCTWCMGQGR